MRSVLERYFKLISSDFMLKNLDEKTKLVFVNLPTPKILQFTFTASDAASMHIFRINSSLSS